MFGNYARLKEKNFSTLEIFAEDKKGEKKIMDIISYHYVMSMAKCFPSARKIAQDVLLQFSSDCSCMHSRSQVLQNECFWLV